ncbi:hypothetical protein PPERSA_09259 [Pseudocohnilembus persalinus]|uniref:C2H2-type domain-containing protein n=1 Tax=Pseudocohnilembus persalinus TaxID=266149 RepID=A0A0V0QLQ2_PSEPJ|nr:hypothetical protein PPERSA_09259 [Pseudocohnilembus persalinus]|eukprot:KRX03247.1 hypothetical protein PPERSA_09259 [Pseudocohnilembus persalinus]
MYLYCKQNQFADSSTQPDNQTSSYPVNKWESLQNKPYPVYYKFNKQVNQFIIRIKGKLNKDKKKKKCPICSHEYKNLYVLRYHLKTQHNVLAYQCKLCQNSYHNIRDLKIHIEDNHIDMKKNQNNVLQEKLRNSIRDKSIAIKKKYKKKGYPPSTQIPQNSGI